MLRSAYFRLLLIMSITILVLLAAIEVATFVVFSRHVRIDGQTELSGEISEPLHAVQAVYDHRADKHDHSFHVLHHDNHFPGQVLSDDSGQNVYFLALDSAGKTVLQSMGAPLTAGEMTREAGSNGFTVVNHANLPYRVYALPFSVSGNTGTIYIYQLILKEQRTLADIAAVLWVVGGVGGVMVVLLNFWLARRALEPARRTWRAQQALLLEVSHELKTPLATIAAIATTDAAGMQALPDSRLIREVRHATTLLEDILYFAQIQSVHEERVEPVAVSDVTEDTIARFDPLARARHMTIHGQAQTGVYVLCTMERWSHLVSILCKNATQHGLAGSNIEWRLAATQNLVTLTIENQMDSAKRPESPAISGIGLRIAERLVKDMRGHLAQSVRGDHVITTVTVPRRNR